MLVRQLIGASAGQIVDMPYHVVQSCLANSTVALVTEDELIAANLQQTDDAPKPSPTIPAGFDVKVRPDRGFDLFHGKVPEDDPEFSWVGTGLNGVEPLPNLAAVRDFADRYLAKLEESELTVAKKKAMVPDNYKDLSTPELKELAERLGIEAEKKMKIIAAIDELMVSEG